MPKFFLQLQELHRTKNFQRLTLNDESFAVYDCLRSRIFIPYKKFINFNYNYNLIWMRFYHNSENLEQWCVMDKNNSDSSSYNSLKFITSVWEIVPAKIKSCHKICRKIEKISVSIKSGNIIIKVFWIDAKIFPSIYVYSIIYFNIFFFCVTFRQHMVYMSSSENW